MTGKKERSGSITDARSLIVGLGLCMKSLIFLMIEADSSEFILNVISLDSIRKPKNLTD